MGRFKEYQISHIHSNDYAFLQDRGFTFITFKESSEQSRPSELNKLAVVTLEIIYRMVLEMRPGCQPPEELKALRTFPITEEGVKDDALTIYRQTNRVMSTTDVGKWDDLNRRQLMLIRNLYIRLDSVIDLDGLALLRSTPLAGENKLESITLDLSERSESNMPDKELDKEIVSMMTAFILASGGFVSKVTIVFSRNGFSLSSDTMVHNVARRLGITGHRSRIIDPVQRIISFILEGEGADFARNIKATHD